MKPPACGGADAGGGLFRVDGGRCQGQPGTSVRESFLSVPGTPGGLSGARFLVFHILFDAEDGSVIGVNDHIENLSTLDDLNLVLAFLVFVFRLGSGAAHFPFSSAYGLGKSDLCAGHVQSIVTGLCGIGSQGKNSQG